MTKSVKPDPVEDSRVDCDTVDPAIWPKLMELIDRLPKDETEEPEDLPDPLV